METLKGINLISKLTLILALLMFIYGILCQSIPIYFFWESLYLSGIVFMIGLIFILNSQIKKRKSESKSFSILMIGKVFIFISIGMFLVINLIFNNSDAFKAIENHIKNDSELKNEFGEIKSVVALPIGSISSITDKHGTSGNATLVLIIKGEKEYKEMSFSAQKDINSDWRIIE